MRLLINLKKWVIKNRYLVVNPPEEFSVQPTPTSFFEISLLTWKLCTKFAQKYKKMEPKAKFKVLYSEEATDFLNSLDVKAKDKILYNIKKSMYLNDPSLFKKLEGNEIWEFRTLYSVCNIVCLRFGTRMPKHT